MLRLSSLTCLAVAAVLAGCTKANPNFLGDEAGIGDGAWPDTYVGDGPRPDRPPAPDAGYPDGPVPEAGWPPPPDGGPVLDGRPQEDVAPLPDLAPREDVSLPPDQGRPDVRPPDILSPDTLSPDMGVPDLPPSPDLARPDQGPTFCQGNWECGDGLSCTLDRCIQGKCVHTLDPGTCLIGGVCRNEGWSAYGDACKECVTSVSTNKLTFVSGKACTVGFLNPGMCVQNACKRWVAQADVEPTLPGGAKPRQTILESVDAVAGGKTIWAVGRYAVQNGQQQGLLRRLDGGPTLPPSPTEVLSKRPLRDISYRLAVGDGGSVYHYGATGWKVQTSIQSAIGTSDRRGVWGAASGATDVFYIAGTHNPSAGQAGILRCQLSGTQTSCAKHTGFDQGAALGPIFAGLSGLSARIWAVRQNNQYDDIYARVSGTTWSDAPPAGCRDGAPGANNQACSNSSGDFRAIHAASPTESWIVGDNGLVLRYQGSGWRRMTLPGVQTSSYQLTAVYTSASEGLVTIVGHVDLGGALRQVGLYNYNIELQRWEGPIFIETLAMVGSGGGDPGQIRHIGGSGYDNLWMVGDRFNNPVNGRRVGWVLRLQ